MNYKSLGSKAYTIGKSLGSRGLSLASLGSKMKPQEPLTFFGNSQMETPLTLKIQKNISLQNFMATP